MRVLHALLSAALGASAAHGAGSIRQTPSGLDLQAIDPSVRPQDDLYRHANGGWLARTSMPPDRVSYGAFSELADRVEIDLHAILLEAARARPASGSPRRQMADLFASHMDEARVEALGLEPVRQELARLEAIRTASDLAAAAGRLAAIGAGAPFAASVNANTANPGWLIVQVSQGGTLLPDRASYLADSPDARRVRAEYEAYLTRLFELVGWPTPAGRARAVLALETALATAQVSVADPDAAPRPAPLTLGQLRTAAPGFDWAAWARPQGLDRPVQVVLNQPSFFKAFAAMVPTTPLDAWQSWLVARFVTASAPQLPKAFMDLRFDFFGRLLTGQQLPRERWKVGIGLVNAHLGDALGRLYVERHFSARARARASAIVSTVIRAQRDLLDRAAWLPSSARTEASRKLGTMTARVGYPDVWRDYRGLDIRPDDLMGNVTRARQFDSRFRARRVTGGAERVQWNVAPQTLNAHYDAALNEVVLPAGFLQPPIFSVDADAAASFGALGAVVGHEITHGLDSDRAFQQRAQALVDQFSAYSPIEGLFVNGHLTLSENIGDLAGLAVAHHAYRLSLDGKTAPVIDGLSGDQRFFLAWAQAWRMRIREDYLRQWLVSLPHAPPEFRANSAPSHLDAFHEAFGTRPGDGMYLAPERRVRIW